MILGLALLVPQPRDVGLGLFLTATHTLKTPESPLKTPISKSLSQLQIHIYTPNQEGES